MRPRSLALLLLLILAIHPLALAIQATLDVVAGDGALWFDLAEMPKRHLAQALVADWLAALPVVAVACGGTAVLGWLAPLHRPARMAYFAALALLVISPAIPGVPLMLGTVGVLSGVIAALWTRSVLP